MRHDAIVVGDGPAGCAAAIAAARAGLDTVLLGRGQGCAAPEHLSAGAMSLLSALAPELATHDDIWLDAGRGDAWDERRIGGPDGASAGPAVASGSGIVHSSADRAAIRSRLDQHLRESAVRQGVRYDVDAAHGRFAPILTGGTLAGVHTPQGDLHATVVIDATGRWGWLRRAWRLAETVDSPRLWLRRGFATGIARGAEREWRLSRDGWVWLHTTRNGSIWTALDLRADAPLALPDGLLPSGPVWRDCRQWRALSMAAGPGYLICGDAAAQLDPATGDGLRFAFASGIRAAGAAIQQCRKPRSAALASALYADWVAQTYASTRALLRDAYADAPWQWPATQVDTMQAA